MAALRERLTYANVVSTLALFLVLCGGIALAARVPKKSVGPQQLKANAVTTSKIKANSITTRKIKRNAVSNAKIKQEAVNSEKIANGSVTGAKIDESSMPFSRIVYEARGTGIVPMPSGKKVVYPLSNPAYIQEVGRDDSYIGAVDLTFQPSCATSRAATAYLLVDAVDPTDPQSEDIVAQGHFVDEVAIGTMKKRINLSSGGGARFQPASPLRHTLSLLVEVECKTGDGVTATFGGADVIGTK